MNDNQDLLNISVALTGVANALDRIATALENLSAVPSAIKEIKKVTKKRNVEFTRLINGER